jgi:integrase
VVLSREEVRRLLTAMPEKYRLFCQLLYGTGMRLMEGLRLRVKDVDFERNQIVVHGGKGAKDRTTMLPDKVKLELQRHLERVRLLWEKDVREGFWRSVFAGGAGAQVSKRGAGVGLAMGVSLAVAVARSAFGPGAASSRA